MVSSRSVLSRFRTYYSLDAMVDDSATKRAIAENHAQDAVTAAVAERRRVQETADVAPRRTAQADATLTTHKNADVVAIVARRQLEEDVARHQRALVEAQRRSQYACAQYACHRRTSLAALAILNMRVLVPVIVDLNAPTFSRSLAGVASSCSHCANTPSLIM